MIDRDELASWLRLLETPKVGRESGRRLLAAFGSPQAVFEAPLSALREVVVAAAARALVQRPAELDTLTDATLNWLQAGDAEAARHVVTLGDPQYPAALLETADPPLLLYAQGQIDLLHRPAHTVAVVGSRNPSPQGADNARAFAAHLSRAGLVVVSGLALGIDGAAHEGALDGPSGTVAVVGTGLDRVYPRRHLDLAHRIACCGVLISEFAIGTPALPSNFPLRNRVIAGLARGTLVVEAALQSGSLITARLALEAGRDVFAIPGSIHSPLSRGCHALIKQGAKLVDSAQDILDEFGQPSGASVASATSDEPASAGSLLQALGFDPVSLDALVARTGRSVADLNGSLLELELDGAVMRLPGQLFQRKGQA